MQALVTAVLLVGVVSHGQQPVALDLSSGKEGQAALVVVAILGAIGQRLDAFEDVAGSCRAAGKADQDPFALFR